MFSTNVSNIYIGSELEGSEMHAEEKLQHYRSLKQLMAISVAAIHRSITECVCNIAYANFCFPVICSVSSFNVNFSRCLMNMLLTRHNALGRKDRRFHLHPSRL